MMRKGARGFWLGFMLAAMLFGFCVPAAAAARQVVATYSGAGVFVNGSKIKAEPVSISGTNYLPLRTVAEALGAEVNWNSGNNTVSITTSSYVQSDGSKYSRTSPAPVGVGQSLTKESYVYGTYNATITLNEVLRGVPAWNKIKEANMFNDKAKDGYEYILAYVKVDVNTNSKDAAVAFSSLDFEAYGASGSKYDRASVVRPEPGFGGDAFAGGSVEGWLAFEVPVGDTAPVMVFGQNFDGSGGVWFSLKVW